MYCPTCGKPNPDDATFCAVCGNVFPGRKGVAATTVPPQAPIGLTVPPKPGVTPRVGEVKSGLFAGRYELHNVLGKGGMGVVYRAKDNELGEEIAIKLLQPQFTKDAHEVDRFKREILTARRITHPNVIRIHDYGTDGDEFFISMELLPGGTLADRIARGVSTTEAVEIAAGVADGLGAAHAKRVVHRDIKPHNVLFDADGTPKLVDFGIARFATATRATRGFAGTPHYISPEQAKGEDATERSDIYSLGVLLFELFTGKLPFDADSLVALAVKHAHEPPPPPRSIRPDLPAAIEAIVLRCLEKDPSNRFATPGEIATALRAVGITPAPEADRRASLPTPPIARPTPPPPRPTPAPVTVPPLRVTPPATPTAGPAPAPKKKSGCFVFLMGIGALAFVCGGLGVTILKNIDASRKANELDATDHHVHLDLDADDDTTPEEPDLHVVATPLALRTLIRPLPTAPIAATPRFQSPLGWSFAPAPGLSFVSQNGGYFLFRDGTTTLWVVQTPGGSLDWLRENGAQTFIDPLSGDVLVPTGDSTEFPGGRIAAIDYSGEYVAGRGAAVQLNIGLVTLLGFGPANQLASTRKRIDDMAATVRDGH